MTDFYVSHSGNDGNAGSEGSPFRTIQKGLDSCAAGDTCKIVTDSDHELKNIYSGTGGVVNVTITDANANAFTALIAGDENWWVGKCVFFRGTTGDDGYGFNIASNPSDDVITVDKATGGRTINNGDPIDYYIGDNDEVSVIMDVAGVIADNTWVHLTSNTPSAKATIKSDSAVFDGTEDDNFISIKQDNQIISSLIFRNNQAGTVTAYAIGADDANEYTGLLVRDCEFYGVKDAVHIGKQRNGSVIDCIIECGTSGNHQIGIVLGGVGCEAINNTIKGPSVTTFTFISCGIAVSSTGEGCIIRGNIIYDWVSSSNSVWNFGGIAISGHCNLIEGNVIYNVTCLENEPVDDTDKWGGIVIFTVIATPHIGAMYNNIILDCIKGINRETGTIGYMDYNCIYNSGTAHIGISAGSNDVTSDPLFVAAGTDFTLAKGSPCFNTGKPSLGGGFSTMGTEQRKQRLDHGVTLSGTTFFEET